MDNWTFGLTVMIVGILGTFFTLWVLALVIGALKKFFPLVEEQDTADKKS